MSKVKYNTHAQIPNEKELILLFRGVSIGSDVLIDRTLKKTK
jgi:hypothetical protein